MSNKRKIGDFSYIFSAFIIMLFLAYFFLVPIIKKWNLENFLEDLSANPNLQKATIAVLAKYEGDSKNLLNHNGDLKIHPGSNFKLFTAAASLNYLGPEFTYKTKIYQFEQDSKKHLLLVGGGDPSLKQKDLTTAVTKFKDTEKFDGNIYYNDDYFSGEKFGPDWEESWKDLYLAVPITGLQINDNLLNIRGGELTSTGQFGIETWPIENYGKFIDEMDYLKSGNDLEVPVTAIMDGDEVIHLYGDTLKNLPFSTSATVKDPSLMTAIVFKQELLKQNLISRNSEIIKWEKAVYDTSLKLLYEHKSQPLEKIIFHMLKFSKNNYAETLIRTIGHEVTDTGTQESGVKVLGKFLNEVGIEESEVEFVDGSGLSPSTRAASTAIIKLFDYVTEQSWRDLFWDSLPESKKDGTLKFRFENVKLKHQVIAKTGTHEHASSLSGKILRPKNKNILFSIHIFNHPYSTEDSVEHIRPLIDKIVALIDKQF